MKESVSVKIEDPVGELRRYFYPISRVRALGGMFFLLLFYYFFYVLRRDVRFFSPNDAQRLVMCARVYVSLLPYAF